MDFKNISQEMEGLLYKVASQNAIRTIKPGEDYIPVTGKVMDAADILLGVDAMLDGWLTAGRFAKKFERL